MQAWSVVMIYNGSKNSLRTSACQVDILSPALGKVDGPTQSSACRETVSTGIIGGTAMFR